MDDPKLDQRLQLVTSKAFVVAVDDWRRKQPDLPSRSEAIRRLVELGLEASAKAKK
jgi:hypothetical protein